MNRRGFLASIIAAGIAPAFVGSSVLMPIAKLWIPPGLRTASIGGVFSGPLLIISMASRDGSVIGEMGFYGVDRNQPIDGIKLSECGGVIRSDPNIIVSGRWA